MLPQSSCLLIVVVLMKLSVIPETSTSDFCLRFSILVVSLYALTFHCCFVFTYNNDYCFSTGVNNPPPKNDSKDFPQISACSVTSYACHTGTASHTHLRLESFCCHDKVIQSPGDEAEGLTMLGHWKTPSVNKVSKELCLYTTVCLVC